MPIPNPAVELCMLLLLGPCVQSTVKPRAKTHVPPLLRHHFTTACVALQVPVMFIQCKGPEARTAASISVSRQREALNSTDDESVSIHNSSNNSSRPTDNSSSGSSGGYSYFNAAEAAVAVDCLQRLLGAGMQPQDLCVITPYRCVAVAWPGCHCWQQC